MKLTEAGFQDFLADTRVSRLKGKRDDNKEVCFVDTISNSAGHKYWMWKFQNKNWSDSESKTKEA